MEVLERSIIITGFERRDNRDGGRRDDREGGGRGFERDRDGERSRGFEPSRFERKDDRRFD